MIIHMIVGGCCPHNHYCATDYDSAYDDDFDEAGSSDSSINSMFNAEFRAKSDPEKARFLMNRVFKDEQ
jgi:hypothetical protein